MVRAIICDWFDVVSDTPFICLPHPQKLPSLTIIQALSYVASYWISGKMSRACEEIAYSWWVHIHSHTASLAHSQHYYSEQTTQCHGPRNWVWSKCEGSWIKWMNVSLPSCREITTDEVIFVFCRMEAKVWRIYALPHMMMKWRLLLSFAYSLFEI